MSTGVRRCMICDAEYEHCRTRRDVENLFRWQDVACCPEHGSEYFAAVLKSRGVDNNGIKSILIEHGFESFLNADESGEEELDEEELDEEELDEEDLDDDEFDEEDEYEDLI